MQKQKQPETETVSKYKLQHWQKQNFKIFSNKCPRLTQLSALNFLSVYILLNLTFMAIICSIIFGSWCIIFTERSYQYKSEDWKMKTLVIWIITFQTQIWWSVNNIQNSNLIQSKIWIFRIEDIHWNRWHTFRGHHSAVAAWLFERFLPVVWKQKRRNSFTDCLTVYLSKFDSS